MSNCRSSVLTLMKCICVLLSLVMIALMIKGNVLIQPTHRAGMQATVLETVMTDNTSDIQDNEEAPKETVFAAKKTQEITRQEASQKESTEMTADVTVQEMKESSEAVLPESSQQETNQQESTSVLPAEFVVHGNQEEKEVALTFDDSGEGLIHILEILDQNGIKGSFFLLAGELRKNPEQWQQAVANGHLILNHTLNHYTDLAQKSEETIREEILGWEDAAKEILGEEYLTRMKKEFPYFRSPGGLESDNLLMILGELGYTNMFYWTVEDVYFSKHNPEGISMADHYVKDAENGGVLLMHPGNWSSLEEIISRLAEEGYSCVPASEILD